MTDPHAASEITANLERQIDPCGSDAGTYSNSGSVS